MWIANTFWNAATLFPSLGYSYQLGLNSSHLTSGICEVAVEALRKKRQPQDRALVGCSLFTETHLQRGWNELCPGDALSSPFTVNGLKLDVWDSWSQVKWPDLSLMFPEESWKFLNN